MSETPITRADLDAALKEFGVGLTEAFSVAIEKAQTEILRGFEVFISASEARIKRLELGAQAMGGSEVLLNSRLAAVELRLLEIERQLLKGRNTK